MLGPWGPVFPTKLASYSACLGTWLQTLSSELTGWGWGYKFLLSVVTSERGSNSPTSLIRLAINPLSPPGNQSVHDPVGGAIPLTNWHPHSGAPNLYQSRLCFGLFSLCSSHCLAIDHLPLSLMIFLYFPFCKRKLGTMILGSILKATAPSFSFSQNTQKSWRRKLLRFTRWSSGT